MTTQPHLPASLQLPSAPPVRPDTATIEWIEWRVEELARERAAGAIEYASWQVVAREREDKPNA
jgi:hypothetical protein